jgi:hypothetical protein
VTNSGGRVFSDFQATAMWDNREFGRPERSVRASAHPT